MSIFLQSLLFSPILAWWLHMNAHYMHLTQQPSRERPEGKAVFAGHAMPGAVDA